MRCVLVRHGLNRLPRNERKRSPVYQRYEKQVPGHHVQIDVKFLDFRQSDGQKARRFQYTAIDDATRIRALKIYEKHTQENAISFLDYVVGKFPLLETGLRPMEFFEMKKDQVSLPERWIKPISYKTGRRRMATAHPNEGIAPLTDRAKAEFEKLLAQSKDDNVFPYRSVKKSWATVCRTAGVKGFWLRWLRDEAENRWREAGMRPLDIAYLMGHASPRTTMIYNNPRRDEIVRQMGAANLAKS